MANKMKFYKDLLGVSIGILALYIGKAFWIYFVYSFGTIVGVWVAFALIGYIYIVIGLTRFKKWAWIMFLTIILLALLIAVPFVAIIGSSKVFMDFQEWFFIMVFWVSLVAIPVFGISALIRKIRKQRVEDKTITNE